MTMKYPFLDDLSKERVQKRFFWCIFRRVLPEPKKLSCYARVQKREYSRHRWVLHAADWLCVSPLVQIAVLPPYCATLQPLDRQVTLIIRAGVEEIFYHHKIKFFGILSHPITACATRPTRLAAASPSAPGAPWRIHRGWTREMGEKWKITWMPTHKCACLISITWAYLLGGGVVRERPHILIFGPIPKNDNGKNSYLFYFFLIMER